MKILEVQRLMQQAYAVSGRGQDPCNLEGCMTGDVLDYIRTQHYFLNEEISELLEEIGGGRQALKPWSKEYIGKRVKNYEVTDKIKSEAIDMLCFAMNICLAAGLTEENIQEEYDKVVKKNKIRLNSDEY